MKRNLCSLALGGFAFWAPFVLLAAIGKYGASILVEDVASLAGLLILGSLSWIAARRLPKWALVLAEVYVFGPTATLTAAVLAHNFSTSPLGHWRVVLAMCLFPPMTVWLAFDNGMIFSVLFVTLTLPLFSLSRRTNQG